MKYLDKLADIKRKILEKEKLLIAYSGGVDSSLLAKIAFDVLGERSLAVILDSETMPRSELSYAEDLAKSLGLNYMVEKYTPLAEQEFAQNPPNRCYYCKKASFALLRNDRR